VAKYRAAAEHAASSRLGVNAGHDLDLDNLPTFLEVPHVDEVSIGHALMARAMFVGLRNVVREYLRITASR
jgi:pyridoxine 5-phosphate synthase